MLIFVGAQVFFCQFCFTLSMIFFFLCGGTGGGGMKVCGDIMGRGEMEVCGGTYAPQPTPPPCSYALGYMPWTISHMSLSECTERGGGGGYWGIQKKGIDERKEQKLSKHICHRIKMVSGILILKVNTKSQVVVRPTR